jgi:hypothetical protein
LAVREPEENMGNFRMVAFGLAMMMALAYVVAMPARADRDGQNGQDDHRGETFVATLSGNEEVPRRETAAVGRAVIRVSDDGTQFMFTLRVARITNVIMAHIHCGTPGVNGPVGVTLLHAMPPGGGPVAGVIAKGVRTAPDDGNGCAWADLAAVLAAIRSGKTYVNVHTNDGVAPANTGPGDFPGGEIRGHLVSVFDDEGDLFVARLSGANEVPARVTEGRGLALIRVSEDRTELHFLILVRDISNVFMAHIHCAAPGVNGPVGVTLYGMGPTGVGPFSGVLVIAMKSAPDPGNACGWTDLAAVAAAMQSGNTYVNVHTNDGVDGVNTGPGDFPGGEIRGQVRALDD